MPPPSTTSATSSRCAAMDDRLVAMVDDYAATFVADDRARKVLVLVARFLDAADGRPLLKEVDASDAWHARILQAYLEGTENNWTVWEQVLADMHPAVNVWSDGMLTALDVEPGSALWREVVPLASGLLAGARMRLRAEGDDTDG